MTFFSSRNPEISYDCHRKRRDVTTVWWWTQKIMKEIKMECQKSLHKISQRIFVKRKYQKTILAVYLNKYQKNKMGGWLFSYPEKKNATCFSVFCSVHWEVHRGRGGSFPAGEVYTLHNNDLMSRFQPFWSRDRPIRKQVGVPNRLLNSQHPESAKTKKENSFFLWVYPIRACVRLHILILTNTKLNKIKC